MHGIFKKYNPSIEIMETDAMIEKVFPMSSTIAAALGL
jgi:hypothetical protein